MVAVARGMAPVGYAPWRIIGTPGLVARRGIVLCSEWSASHLTTFLTSTTIASESLECRHVLPVCFISYC